MLRPSGKLGSSSRLEPDQVALGASSLAPMRVCWTDRQPGLRPSLPREGTLSRALRLFQALRETQPIPLAYLQEPERLNFRSHSQRGAVSVWEAGTCKSKQGRDPRKVNSESLGGESDPCPRGWGRGSSSFLEAETLPVGGDGRPWPPVGAAVASWWPVSGSELGEGPRGRDALSSRPEGGIGGKRGFPGSLQAETRG